MSPAIDLFVTRVGVITLEVLDGQGDATDTAPKTLLVKQDTDVDLVLFLDPPVTSVARVNIRWVRGFLILEFIQCCLLVGESIFVSVIIPIALHYGNFGGVRLATTVQAVVTVGFRGFGVGSVTGLGTLAVPAASRLDRHVW